MISIALARMRVRSSVSRLALLLEVMGYIGGCSTLSLFSHVKKRDVLLVVAGTFEISFSLSILSEIQVFLSLFFCGSVSDGVDTLSLCEVFLFLSSSLFGSPGSY